MDLKPLDHVVTGEMRVHASVWGAAVLKGVDVYLFLIGMMVLAELARHEGLFDWLVAGAVVALFCNVVNNLPLGLLAGTVATGAHLPPHVTGAILIGVDLGPNLSVTGSLATILWLVALRREGQAVSGWNFFKLGCIVMPPALIASLAIVIR